jgi:phosphoserine phosphatase
MPETTTHALLLTASPAAPGLDETVIAALRPQLAPAQLIDQRWLAEGVAWQGLVVTRAPGEQVALRARLGAALAPRPIDINLVPADPATRRKKLLVADMESTIIEQECLDELAARVGLGERISEITVRAMRGELVFEAALKERVALLKGLDAAILEDIYASRVTLMSGAATLVATMRRHGAHCALVSGGFSFFSERIAARLHFDSQQANTLEIVDGRLAGSVRQPILGREAKLASLKRLTRALQLDASDTLAVGDGANDLSMLRAAGLGVAFRAKPIVAAAAAVRIEHGDLTALLYLQGYARHEFDSGRAG